MPKQVLVIAAIAGTAHAGEPVPRELADVCGDRLGNATGSRLVGRHDEETIYQVDLPKRQSELVIAIRRDNPCAGGDDVCDIVPMGKPDAQLAGRFGAGGKRLTAAVVMQPDCAPGNCASVLMLRSGDKIVDALSTGECYPTLSAIALVPGQDSIALLCASQAGAGDHVEGGVYHVVAGKLVSELAFPAGSSIPATNDERAIGECTIGPIGKVAVVKAAGGSRLRVTRAPEQGQTTAAGDGPSCKRQQGFEQDYRWDAGASKLVEDGPARAITRSTCDCKR
jgi:hypothetical protein